VTRLDQLASSLRLGLLLDSSESRSGAAPGKGSTPFVSRQLDDDAHSDWQQVRNCPAVEPSVIRVDMAWGSITVRLRRAACQ
jgi:hypothetical protein